MGESSERRTISLTWKSPVSFNFKIMFLTPVLCYDFRDVPLRFAISRVENSGVGMCLH